MSRQTAFNHHFMQELAASGVKLLLHPLWPWLSNLLLASLLGYGAMDLGLKLQQAPPHPDSTPVAPSQTASAVPATRSAPSLQNLLQSQWFGEAEATAPAPAQPRVAPETRLALTLRGVLFSADKQKAKVIVAGADGKGHEYTLGKTLPGGALLQEIYPDRIILERNGRYETLRLQAKHKTDGSGGSLRPATASVHSGTFEQSQQLSAYRREILQQPARMGEYLRVSAAMENQQFVGYRIAPGRRGGLLPQFGLQNGDIITRVNDTRLDSPLRGLKILEQLAEAQQLEVEILRDGQTQIMQFSLTP